MTETRLSKDQESDVDSAAMVVRRSLSFLGAYPLIVAIAAALALPSEIILEMYPFGDTWPGLLSRIAVVSLLQIIFVGPAAAALVHAVAMSEGGERPEAVTFLSSAWTLGAAAIALRLVAEVAVSLGLLLLIIPGILLALAWYVAMPVLALEGKGPVDALKRSAELTRGRRGRLFGIAFVVGVVGGLPNLIVTWASDQMAPPGDDLFLAGAAVRALLGAVVTVFWIVSTGYVYLDLVRGRGETHTADVFG
jgi:hypothetical protein